MGYKITMPEDFVEEKRVVVPTVPERAPMVPQLKKNMDEFLARAESKNIYDNPDLFPDGKVPEFTEPDKP